MGRPFVDFSEQAVPLPQQQFYLAHEHLDRDPPVLYIEGAYASFAEMERMRNVGFVVRNLTGPSGDRPAIPFERQLHAVVSLETAAVFGCFGSLNEALTYANGVTAHTPTVVPMRVWATRPEWRQ